jgi:hypothetical protein
MTFALAVVEHHQEEVSLDIFVQETGLVHVT